MTNVSPNDYHNHDGWTVTSTSFRDFMRSPNYYYHRYVLGEKEEDSGNRNLAFGSAMHCILLEPLHFYERFYVDPHRGGSKGSKDLAAENHPRERLTEKEMKALKFISKMVQCDAYWKRHIEREDALIERAFEAKMPDGITLKCKPDVLTETAIIDVKTFGRERSQFDQHAAALMYQVQGAFYAATLAFCGDDRPRDFVMYVICKREPHQVFPVVIPHSDLLAIWEKTCRPHLKDLRRRLVNHDWEMSDEQGERPWRLRKKDVLIKAEN